MSYAYGDQLEKVEYLKEITTRQNSEKPSSLERTVKKSVKKLYKKI